MKKMKRLTVTGLCFISLYSCAFLYGCAPAIENTKNASNVSSDQPITAMDLAKEPVTTAAPAPYVSDNAKVSDAGSPRRQPDNAIKSIEVANEFVNITAAKPFRYRITDTDDPYTKMIDLYDVSPGRFEDIILPGSTKVADITVRPSDAQRTNAVVVLTLTSIVRIKDNYSENNLSLSFAKAEPGVSSTPLTAKPAQKKGRSPAGKYITGIQFAKDSDKAARVEITGDGTLTADVFTLEGRVVADLRGAKMAAAVPTDIAPPLNSIRWSQYNDKVRIVMDLSDNTVYKAEQLGDKLVIYIADAAALAHAGEKAPAVEETPAEAPAQPAASKVKRDDKPAAKEPKPQAAHDSEPVTMDFNNVEVTSVLKLIAAASGFSVVVDPQVSGKVSIHVKDMPWEKALDLVMDSSRLKKIVEGGVIRIVPGETLASSAGSKSGQSLYISDISVTFSDANGVVKTIKRANLAAGDGGICLDLNQTDTQPVSQKKKVKE
ncbi:MAG: AMIN domain-containing protein [Nitrospirae bacterium]|nr:AMIN domain-containing protein [Nitrospirota bacterium]